MTRDEIEKALDSIVEDFFIKRRIIDIALACCARQAEEDAKILENLRVPESNALFSDETVFNDTLQLGIKEIRASAPTCGELSRTKVDK